jgi:hypothetical protein
MTTRSLLLAGTLALSCLTLANAKSYNIMLSSPANAGTLQLKAGAYQVKVEGSNAVFTNVDSGKKFTAPVKIENASKKFDQTAVDTTSKSGTDQIQSIELGGSTTQLQFGE